MYLLTPSQVLNYAARPPDLRLLARFEATGSVPCSFSGVGADPGAVRLIKTSSPPSALVLRSTRRQA
jgi:hypothetical protein